ncbi:hypothetical protein C8R45DRAFT_882343 [Mycena sanguinolenta]|nr:hypothetical protein C8R45DRAFT_882343 [Mycena sanguinolenta]
MYWNQRDSTPSTSGSSSTCSTPLTLYSDLPRSSSRDNAWPSSTVQTQTANEVLQSVLKIRKTWKCSRGGETIWPLDLEAALLEGLQRYQPDDSRETRMLGRFPRRNRFISDHIFDKTGIRRSPKQVGSRLQQLRESCGNTKLLDLLSPFRKPTYRAPSQCDSTLSSPISSVGFFPNTSSPPHTIIYIDILPEGSPDKIRAGTSPSMWSDDGDVIHASDHPRRLKSINPTASFTSSSPIIANSRFTVYSEDLILHAETVPLGLVLDQPHQRSRFLYSAQLVPKYWKVIVDSPDPTRFTIFQEVYNTETTAVLFSATYKFSYKHASSSHSGSRDVRRDVPTKATPESLHGTQHPMYSSSAWNSPSLHSREISHLPRYPNQNGDTSFLYFPPELPTWH